MSDSIFGSLAIARSLSAWSKPQTYEQPAKPLVSNPVEARDAALIAIVEARLEPGETTYTGFARKEEQLRAAFAALSVLEARSLHARLSSPRTGDRFAAAFSRMTVERRARLINFLGNAGRREALAL
jgi:hypothetical protein